MILDSKIIPLEYRIDRLLRSLLVLSTKKPRNNPKNKNNTICLGRSIKGIEEKLNPPAPVEKNIYYLTKKDMEKYDIRHLPESLGHALNLMEESLLMRETLGNHIFENFLHVKQQEWEAYRMQVSPWEVKKYLQVL